MPIQLKVLPGFAGGFDGDAGGYGIVPDVDGHSVWHCLQKDQSFPTNTDINGVPVVSPGAEYLIEKVDLLTQARTAVWIYPYAYPTFCNSSSLIAWTDNAGKFYVLDHSGVLYKVDPTSSFTQIGSVLQSSNSAAPGFFNSNLGAYVVDWCVWTVSGNDYVAILSYPSALSGSPQLIVVNLTALTVVGNWWHDDPTITGQFLFVDANGNLWIGLRDDSGFAPSGDLTLKKWTPSDGTVAQPANPLGLVDPYLNITFSQVVANSIFSPSGYKFDGAQSPSTYGRYISQTNSVLLGTIPGSTSGPNFSFGGDLAVVDLTTFLATATHADDGVFFGGQSYQDIHCNLFRQSKLAGFDGTIPIVIVGMTAAGNRQMGGLVRILSSALSLIDTRDLTSTAANADPLSAAGLAWSFYQSGANNVGDLVIGNLNDFYKVINNQPVAVPPSADFLLINVGDVVASGLTYRGLWDSTVTYNFGDVVGRADFPPGTSRFRVFTATRTHSNVDPFNAGSDTWIPAFGPSHPYWPAGPNNETYPPLGNVLHFTNPERFVYAFNFIGSPLYLFINAVTPPPPDFPSPPGGDHFTPKPPLTAGPVQNIPLDNSPNQVWNVTVLVNDVPVTLSIVLRYNELAEYWVATVRDINGNVLLDSLPFVTGEGISQNLLGQFAYLGIGSATIFNASGQAA